MQHIFRLFKFESLQIGIDACTNFKTDDLQAPKFFIDKNVRPAVRTLWPKKWREGKTTKRESIYFSQPCSIISVSGQKLNSFHKFLWTTILAPTLPPMFVRGWNFTENNLTKEDITPWDANMVFVSVFCRRRFEIIKIPRATAETPGRVKHTTENLRETQTDTFPVWDSSDLENWRWFLNFAFSTPW